MHTMTATTQTVDRQRITLAAVAPIGPIGMALWSWAVPYHVMDEPASRITAVANDMGRVQWAMWGLLLFALTAGVGAIVTGLVARQGSYRLGTAGLVLTFLGFSALNFSSGTADSTAGAAQLAGLDLPTSERVVAGLDEFQAPTIGGGLFIPLMFIGVLLLGIALWRGQAVPKWAAAILFVSFPVVLFGGFVSMAVNGLGWALMAVGFGAAGFAYARRVAIIGT